MQAAQRQGKAWLLHDIIFKNRKALSDEQLAQYAKQVGLDIDTFKADYQKAAVAKEVSDDDNFARSIQVSGTPTTFINGTRVGGAKPYEHFEKLVEEEIKRAQSLLDSGTPRKELYRRIAAEKVKKQPRPQAKKK
jgi:predicted DsbA family dithiol-disulfide isomerase